MKQPGSIPAKEYFSTGEAAVLCSVTPDTVLKWIRAGKLPATRTPGGHHRIPRNALVKLFGFEEGAPDVSFRGEPFRYCWEFNAKSGIIAEGCKDCIVYRSKTRRCYEVKNLSNAGFVGLYCEGTCEECEYYKMVRDQHLNVLVVTDKSRLKDALERDSGGIDFNLRITDCEYRCSMLVEQFRPDYAIIDCSLGIERSYEFARFLYEDPRLPFVRIVLAGNQKKLPGGCDQIIHGLIDRHFTIETISGLIHGSDSLPQMARTP